MENPFGTNIDANEAATLLGVASGPQDAGVIVREAPAVPKAEAAPIKEPRIKIMLEENDDIPPTGLFVAVNGYGYMIKPGLEAAVPISVLEVLNHAIKSVPVTDPVTQQVLYFKDRLRFPYRVMGAILPQVA